MDKKEYYRNGKISKGLEVTKADLFELKSKNDFISISEADLNNIKDNEDSDVVGIIMGDVESIFDGSNVTFPIENPDCWFVYNPKKHGYIELTNLKNLTFGDAIALLKLGYKVAREVWNSDKAFIVLMPSLYLPPFNTQEAGAKVNDRTAKHIGKDSPLDSQPYIAMYTVTGQWQPGWVASQSDILAEDYYIV